MGIRKRHNKWWVDFSFDGKRYRRPSPDNTRSGAQVFEAVLKQRLARGEPTEGIKGEIPTYQIFAKNWFQVYVKNNNKYSEIRSKEMILRVHLIPFFGRMKLDKITNLETEKYKARKLQERLSAKTVNNHLAVLRKSLNSAFEWGNLPKPPIIKKLETPPQSIDFLSETECNKLIQHADGYWRDMIIIALGTGMRFGELIGLTWDNIDFRKREITVKQAFAKNVLGSPKSNRIRCIPMSDSVYQSLSCMRKKGKFIFMSSRGNHLDQNVSLRKIKTICRKAGVRSVGWIICNFLSSPLISFIMSSCFISVSQQTTLYKFSNE